MKSHAKDYRKFVIAPEWYKGHKYRGRFALEYRVIAEEKIGRPLTRHEVVHHIDGNKCNNSPCNLEVLSFSEHSSKHGAQKKQKMVEMICPICRKHYSKRWGLSVLNTKRYNTTYCSRPCLWIGTTKSKKHLKTEVVRVFWE